MVMFQNNKKRKGMARKFVEFALDIMILVIATRSHAASPIAKPGCADRCGGVSIPFPFGTTEGCYLNDYFFVNCSRTAEGDTSPFLGDSDIEIRNISLARGQLTVMHFIARDCYDRNGTSVDYADPAIWFSKWWVSNTANKFVVVGCDTTGSVTGDWWDDRVYETGCTATCRGEDDIENGACSGVGCCQTSFPKNVRIVNISLESNYNYTHVSNFSTCGYAFVVEEAAFTFSSQSVANLRNVEMLPMVIDWSIGEENCNSAANIACKSADSVCYEPYNGIGYRCNCSKGYQGNPYIHGGCRDIDECRSSKLNNCEKHCENIRGGFKCACPKGYYGDGTKTGKGCIREGLFLFRLVAEICIGFIVLLVCACWLYLLLQRRRLIKMRRHYFRQNGGLLLQEKLGGRDVARDAAIIFSQNELKKATNSFHSSNIIGQGGYGTVYKGSLPDNRVVAIKKAKEVPKHADQFANEVIVLSQINHRNVVKLLGCCLETKVPLLVYEFVSKGTLYEHIHNKVKARSLSWNTRLKIAAETAGVLSYLHSEASTPIIHRDVKSSNILLDDNFTAKVSDFGASRLFPLDHAEITTLVQGTFGYLDPSYMQTSQLTEKSDVYSFGVVLVELLTGRKAVSNDRPEEERSLANFFLSVVEREELLFQILEDNVMRECDKDVVMRVAVLAKRCLNVRGDERPCMKEVEMELEALRFEARKHTLIQTEHSNAEDEESVHGDDGFNSFTSIEGTSTTSMGFDSVKDNRIR